MRAGPRLWCTVTSAVLRTEPIRSDASRFSSWCARTMRARGTSASGRRWRRNIWQPTTAWKCRAKHCGAGCSPRVCGAAVASAKHRTRRQRKAHFGELILDGSHHHWLEERGPKACLMNFVDDATGVALCRFSDQETTWAAADLLAAWVRQHGVPKALYCDWKNRGKRWQASSPRRSSGACVSSALRCMAASSPQAKGRVDHGTHQDRLIKKMRLRGIVEEAANLSTRSTWPSTTSASPVSRRRPTFTRRRELRGVFCCEYERVVSNDRVVRFENRCLQLKSKRNQGVGAGARVTVQQWRDESLQVRFDGHEIEHDVIATPTPQLRTKPAPQQRPGGGRKPAADHPWRRAVLRKKRAANT